MKFSALVVLGLCSSLVSAVPQRGNGRNRGGNTGNTGANNGQTGGNTGNNGTNTGNTGNTGNNGTNTGNTGGNTGGDPQTSLTLDPKVVSAGFQNNGQDVPTDGQVASLTSSNNFINFCLTTNLPLTNGQQVKGGSCNTAPIGMIPSTSNMPASKFVFPANGGTVPADQDFTIQMGIARMQTGNFVNANENYFAAPQQLNGQGQIIGHTHVVIEKVSSLASTQVPDPNVFQFFKGINGAAQNGIVTADVADGVPAGTYRLCSINAAANHQPVIVPIAQHGGIDDCVYFTATSGGGTGNNGANGGNNGTNTGNNQGGNAGNTGNNQGGNNGANNGANGGATGNTGNTGNTGATGNTGNTGNTGATGNTGNNGQGGRGGRGGRGGFGQRRRARIARQRL